jgi:hypothetical protein
VTLPDDLIAVLPPGTAEAWPKVASLMPPDGILMGGTALAARLHHRVSRDLDVFMTQPFDPDVIREQLSALGRLAVTSQSEGTLNALLDDVKVQFLHARGQHVLEPPKEIAGMRVGAMSDVIATKLQAVAGRGELRDYLDLKKIEETTGRLMEEGLGLWAARYDQDPDDQTPFVHIVRALGSFDDVGDDPTLPETREQIVTYWARRQPEIVAHLDRFRSG